MQNRPQFEILDFQVIDPDGFRPNVGIILGNAAGKVLWAKRVRQDSWQFPQGGIDENESVEDAMYRELHEELGLRPEDVEIMGCTRGWLRYRLPKKYIRKHQKPKCIGQKQKWYMLKLVGDEENVRFDATGSPEFDGWRWVDYWYPLKEVVFFKKDVYRKALKELAPLLPGAGKQRRRPRRGKFSRLNRRKRTDNEQPQTPES